MFAPALTSSRRVASSGSRVFASRYWTKQATSHVSSLSNRRFSELATVSQSTTPATATTVAAPVESSSLESSSLFVLCRHGPGDGVIKLNVGGKEFVTLRSTVYLNPVLQDHVLRAEANKEFTHGGEAVFIDRDPAQFGLILQHLRNEAAGLKDTAAKLCNATKAAVSSNAGSNGRSLHLTRSPRKNGSTLIQIPEDQAKMRELFVEARHYQIKELEAILCQRSLFIQLASFMGKGSNPFAEASQMLANLRRAFLASSGIGIFVGRDSVGDWLNDVKALVLGQQPSTKAATKSPEPVIA
jgi:hypothetical protein